MLAITALLPLLAGCGDKREDTISGSNTPVLQVSSSSLTFSAQQGSSPGPQTITISNTGKGTLDWSASLGGTGWLGVSASSGSVAAGASTSVTVSLSTAAMAAGSYTGTIELKGDGAANSPSIATVTLVITPPPALEASAASLSFSAQQDSTPAPQTLTIRNAGGGTLSWSAGAGPAWLRLTPSSGSVAAGASMPVAVSVNTAALASGAYSGTIQLTAPGATGSPRAVPVTLALTPPPALTLGAASLSFAMRQGTDPPGQTLTITNTGGGSLAWSASEPIPWLVGSPASGTLAAGQSGALNLSVNAEGLAPGRHTGILTIAAPGAANSPRTVEVALTVAPPPAGALEVSPASLSFTMQQGANPAGQTVTITNTGDGALAWTASEPIAWLVGSPASGTLAPGQSGALNLNVNAEGLASGRYTGTLTIAAPGAANSPRTVEVALTVAPPPAGTLEVSPASLSFTMQHGANPDGQTVTISNTGAGPLTWTASEPIAWLVGSPASGTLAPGQSGALNLSINAEALAPGRHTGTLTIAAPGANGTPRTVEVALTVAPPPAGALDVSPASLAFAAEQGTSPAGQTVTISNTGAGPLSWTASEPIGWLVGSPASGTLSPGQSAALSVAVNSGGLAAGRYTGAITVSAPGAAGAPRSVEITLTVAARPAAPALSVSPGTLAFTTDQGSNRAAQTLTISNTGGGTLTWSASEPIPWLVGSPAGGSVAAGESASLGITVNSAGMAPGSYEGTVVVTAAGATESPRNISVTLRISAAPQAPALGVTPATLTFSAGPAATPGSQSFTISNTGGGTLRWSAAANVPWLSVGPSAGSLEAADNASVAVTVSTAGLSAGTHRGTITLSAPGADGSPRTVGVTLTMADGLLAAPAHGSPANGATDVATSPAFSWSAVPGANRYWLMIATDQAAFPTSPSATSCPGCTVSGNTGATSHTLPQAFPFSGRSVALSPNTRYYWKVQGWNTDSRQGQYPAASSFTTPASSVTATLAGLNPHLVEALNTRQVMTLTGTGFGSGTRVFYRNRYQTSELPPGDIQVVSPTEIRASVTLGTTAATWYVSVQNAGTARSPEIAFRTVRNDYLASWIIGPPCELGADSYNFVRSNCTSFVAWRLDGDGKRIMNNHGQSYTCSNGSVVARWTHAVCWDESARRLGLRVDKSPEVGAVAQWNWGDYGHVAYVAAVYLNTGEILVEEYNYSHRCRYGTRRIRISTVENFIHF